MRNAQLMKLWKETKGDLTKVLPKTAKPGTLGKWMKKAEKFK